MGSKVCTKCRVEKEIELFTENNKIKSGYTSRCKECTAEYKKEYALLNSEAIKTKRKKYYEENKEQILEKGKIYRENNKEKVAKSLKKYAFENKEVIAEYQKEYKRLNKEKRSKYEKEKQLLDPLYALTCKIRKNILKSFKEKKTKKTNKTEDILGCTFEEFKKHIESQFESWMNWDNRGLYNGNFNYGWDIDHKIPLAIAKTEEEIIKLNHYTNLQPLCSKINRDIKRNKRI